MKKQLLILLIFFTYVLSGNDGAYRSSGGIIYPINEEVIILEKEILSFKVEGDICHVNIQFTFNNPLKENKKVLTGFQAPEPSGDIDEKEKVNRIENFKIFFENKLLPYTIKWAYEEDGQLYTEKNFTKQEDEENYGIYVYLFEIDFKPGKNIINHSYSFPASSNVVFQREFSYILKTGAKWADKQIKDLTLEIDMGDNQYFFVRDIFGSEAEWSIVGVGKMKNNNVNDFFKMIRILSGKLNIKVKNLSPTENIHFGIVSNKSFGIGRFSNDLLEKKLSFLETFDFNDNCTKEQLRFFRNAIYAKYGYNFKDPSLKKIFLQYDWYIPDPNVKIEEMKLDYSDKILLNKILEKEKIIN